MNFIISKHYTLASLNYIVGAGGMRMLKTSNQILI